MKNLSVYFLILLGVLFTSCDRKVIANFELVNKTNQKIDSINIVSFDDNLARNFTWLEPNETKSYQFDMTNLPKVDGDYFLTFKTDSFGNSFRRFGYFTNGFPMEKITIISFEKDTVIIEQQF